MLYTKHSNCSAIHNGQDAEKIFMCIDRWMKEENMAYMYRIEYHSALKKRKHSEIHDNMNEHWGHYGKRNKPVIERQILYYSTFMRYLIIVKSTESKNQMEISFLCFSKAGERGKWGVINQWA